MVCRATSTKDNILTLVMDPGTRVAGTLAILGRTLGDKQLKHTLQSVSTITGASSLQDGAMSNVGL